MDIMESNLNALLKLSEVGFNGFLLSDININVYTFFERNVLDHHSILFVLCCVGFIDLVSAV